MVRPKSGTPEGDRALAKWRATMKRKYGENTDFFKNIGRKGGENGRGPNYKGGFASDRGRTIAVEAGRKGGLLSRRGLIYQYSKDGIAFYKNADGKEVKYEIKN